MYPILKWISELLDGTRICSDMVQYIVLFVSTFLEYL
jgi:hypothetical protein